jgi:Leucine-rich repeat (LRR) protein
LPQFLLELWCTNNTLVALPPNLPQCLQVLWGSYNNIVELPPNLPQSLQILDCHNNKLIELPLNPPQSLQVLNCYHNNLRALPPNLPQSLLELRCGHNKLVALPTNLHEYRNLTRCDYSGNEIEYIPPHITRFLNRLHGRSGKNDKIYDDGQNVHNHQIQESIRNSIYAVMKVKPSITTDEMNSQIIASVVLTEKTKRLLMEYCEDENVHSVIGITFKELLLTIWSIIRDHKDINEIHAIMNTEMDDADCKCFTGKMSRLINCLNGYDSRVSITMADNDQISNIIIIEKEKLEINGHYDIETHKDNVRTAMEERGYAKETIEEWNSYIE